MEGHNIVYPPWDQGQYADWEYVKFANYIGYSDSIINKLLLILSLLVFTSCVAVGPKCTYTQDGTKISSVVWFYKDKPIDLDKINCN